MVRRKPTDDRARVQSVEIGHQVLDCLARKGKATSLTDLANSLGVSTSKVHRYLVSLIRCGLVEQDDLTSNYDLGPAALSLGLLALGRLDYHHHGQVYARRLRDAVNLNVSLSVWSERGPVIVTWLDVGQPIEVAGRIGSSLSSIRSNTGRVFLAYRSEREIDDVFAKAYSRRTPPTNEGQVLTRKSFHLLLADVRERRLARVLGDYTPGIDSLSAPVFDSAGNVVLALSLIGQHGTFDVAWDGPIAKALSATTAELSARLGFVDTAGAAGNAADA